MRNGTNKTRTGSAEISSTHEIRTEEKKDVDSDHCLIGETKIEINKTPDLVDHVKLMKASKKKSARRRNQSQY